jgi:nuclear pore complex protein Nup98-Nup96
MASDSGSSRADEEDEEDEEPPSDSSRLSPDNQRASARATRGTYTTEEAGEEDGSGGSSRSSLEEVPLPEHRRGDPSIIPWAQRIGIDPQKMHVMHASLFPPAPESAEAPKRPHAEKPDRVRLTPDGGLHRKHSRDSEGDGLRAATQEVCVTFFSLSPSRGSLELHSLTLFCLSARLVRS